MKVGFSHSNSEEAIYRATSSIVRGFSCSPRNPPRCMQTGTIKHELNDLVPTAVLAERAQVRTTVKTRVRVKPETSGVCLGCANS